MTWTCPHCGVMLAIGDDKMTTSWSFSRCFQCGGYALVRRSEVNIIKVDRVPAGEKLMMSEAPDPRLAAEAVGRDAGRPAAASGAEKSIVKPALRRNVSQSSGSPTRSDISASFPGLDGRAKSAATQPSEGISRAVEAARQATTLPTEALPPNALPPDAFVAQPFSGLYSPMPPLTGPNAPAGAVADRSTNPGVSYVNGTGNGGFAPEPLPDVPVPTNRLKVLPIAIGIAAAVALGSCVFFFIQDDGTPVGDLGPTPLHGTASEPSRSGAEVSQSPSQPQPVSGARASPAAPERAPDPHSTRHLERGPEAQVSQTEVRGPQLPVAPASRAPAIVAAAKTTVSDQVSSQAMAPDRKSEVVVAPTAPQPVQLSSENPPLVVQPRAKNTQLRSGPGMEYQVVSDADESARYVVTDWNDRWFKVLPQVPPKGSVASDDATAGWVRTDAVRVVPEPTLTSE